MTNQEVLQKNKSKRVGEISVNKFGTNFQLIDYVSCSKVLIETLDAYKYKKWVQYRDFKRGAILSPFDRTVFGVGYLGVGQYDTCKNKNKLHSYVVWQDMLRRCYDTKMQAKRPTYKKCIVADEWHNYQNFAQWWNDNYYDCNNETMCLDKDILMKGNTIYSSDTCLIVPSRINTLIENCTASRGNLPLGVSFDKNVSLFKSTSRKIVDGKSEKVHIGFYNTPEEAFVAYKKWKEQYIKEVVDKYKGNIPKVLYDALYEYEVEITD